MEFLLRILPRCGCAGSGSLLSKEFWCADQKSRYRRLSLSKWRAALPEQSGI